jgi:hypothetical protein
MIVDTLNVRDFGAVGNGDADDTEALQAAISAACAGSKLLFLPKGTYRVTSGLSLASSITMRGAGMAASVVQYTADTGALFTATGDISYSHFTDMKWKGPGQSSGGSAVGFVGPTTVPNYMLLFERLAVQDWPQDGFQIYDSFNCRWSDCRLSRCGVVGTLDAGGIDGSGGGIQLLQKNFVGAASTGNVYTNCYFTRCHRGVYLGPSTYGNGASVSRVFNTKLDRCFAEYCYIGFDLAGKAEPEGRGISRYVSLDTCYGEANLYALAVLGEGTNVACYQNKDTPTGQPGSPSADGPNGIVYAGRYVDDRPAHFMVGNADESLRDLGASKALVVDKSTDKNYVSNIVFADTAIRFGTPAQRDVGILVGKGNPEGSFSAQPGTLYLRREGGASGDAFVKSTGTGNTGWMALSRRTQFDDLTNGATTTLVAGRRVNTNAATLFSHTLTFPAAPAHDDDFEFMSVGEICALTLTSAGGHSIHNAPTQVAAGGSFAYRFDSGTATWYRMR